MFGLFILCSLVLLCSLVELWIQSFVGLSLRYNLDKCLFGHTFLCSLGLIGVLSKLYLFWFLKVCACIFTICISYIMLTLLDPIYRVNSINPKSAKMCMKFKFISICTYLYGVCLMYFSLSNCFGPNKFGDHFVLECVLGTLDLHWMLVSLIRKVVPPYFFWR